MKSISADKEEHQHSLRKMKAVHWGWCDRSTGGEEDVHLEKWGMARTRRVLNASLRNLNVISH